MNNCILSRMDARKFITGVAVVFLGYFVIASLLLTANSTVFVRITSDPHTVKSVINDSGAYAAAGPLLIDYLAKQQDASGLPLDQPQIRQTASEILDARLIQSAIEPAIDDTYGWLENGQGDLDFAINIKPAKDQLSANLSNVVEKRLAKLPDCSYDQLAKLQSAQIDPFKMTCSPSGINKSVLKNQINKTLYQKELGLLSGQKISFESLNNETDQTISSQLKDAPQAFQSAEIAPWAAGLFGLLAAVGLVFLGGPRKKGPKYLGITLLISASSLVAAPYAVNVLLDNAATGLAGNAFASEIAVPILRSFNEKASGTYFIFGAASLIVGAIALFISQRLKNQSKPES